MNIESVQRDLQFFQSSGLSDEEIKQHFVVRKNEYDRIIDEIKKDDMKGSVQHFILIGRRGSGKSTLLRRVQAEINTVASLNKRLIVINPSEEQAGIYRLYDLWERVIQDLKLRGYEVKDVLWSDYSDDEKNYSKALYQSIREVLNKNNKKLILLLDNIDRIFDTIGKDSHLLRELLTNYNDMRIIGGSTRMSEHYWKYEKPFYQFFSLVRLDALSATEIKTLLLYWSNYLEKPEVRYFVENHPEKLDVVRTLTDGMPRTLLYFIKLLIGRPEQNGFNYLRIIIDKATPVYQERLLRLPAAQQKIVLELSFFWDAVKVKSLMEKCRMTGKIISAQLNQLVKAGVVDKIKGLKKDNLYRISERFFNLWLLMTQGGPEEKHQVKYLTVFLESWYSKEELQKVLSDHIGYLKSANQQPGHIALMSKALVHSRHLSISQRDTLIEDTRSYRGIEKEDLVYLPEPSNKIFIKVVEKINAGEYNQAERELLKIEQECVEKDGLQAQIYFFKKEFESSEKHFLKTIKENGKKANYKIAFFYDKIGRRDEAEKYYLKAIDDGEIDALYNLAILLNEDGRKKEAEKYYIKAIDKGHIGALNNLAIIFEESNKTLDAEKYLLRACKFGDINAPFNIANIYREQGKEEKAKEFYLQAINRGHVDALNNLANMIKDDGNKEKAQKYYLQAIDKGDVNALFNLANMYYENGKKDEALTYYLKAIAGGHNIALNNLAVIYDQRGSTVEAEKYYLEAIEKGNINSMFNLGILYRETDRLKEAETYFLQAIENGDVDSLLNIANLYSKTDRPKEAEKYYLQAIEKGDVHAMINLAVLYYSENKKSQEVLQLMQNAVKLDGELKSQAVDVIFLLWAGKMNEFEEKVQKVFSKALKEKDTNILDLLISDLLIHHQYNLVWDWFTSEETGEKLKKLLRPLYFVAAKFVAKPETKEELLKAGPEIQESIDQIRESILARQAFYYKKSK